MKVQTITCLILLIMLVSGCTNSSPSVNTVIASPSPEPKLEVSSYVDPDYRISFKHPISWQVTKQNKNAIYINDPQSGSLYGRVDIYENPKRLSLKEFELGRSKTEKSSLVKPLISDSHLKINITNGFEAYQIETVCEPVECSQYVVVMDDIVLRISNFKKSSGSAETVQTNKFIELINSLKKNL